MTKKTAAKPKKTPPQTVEQAMTQAWQALGEGNPREAELLCAQLVKAHPAHAHAWFLRGIATTALGKPQLALKHLDKVQGSPELLPALAQARGRALLALARIEEALQCFQEALLYKPDDASVYYYLAVTQLRLGATEAAQRFLRQCSLLDPKFGPAHYEQGVLAMQAGQAKAAAISFRSAAQSMPQSPEAANNLGLAEQALGNAVAAEQGFRNAIVIDKNYAEAWFNLGNLLTHLGREEESHSARATAYRLNPDLRQLVS